jgi:acyl-coenzyme A thioesterase PaaI-like protein
MSKPDEQLVQRFLDHNVDCLGCGADNPFSLGFVPEHASATTLTSPVRFARGHQGGPGLVHGGMIATALDEALGRCACIAIGGYAVTARLVTDFDAPVPVVGDYTVAARVESIEGRKVWATGELLHADGAVLARASGLWLEVPDPR